MFVRCTIALLISIQERFVEARLLKSPIDKREMKFRVEDFRLRSHLRECYQIHDEEGNESRFPSKETSTNIFQLMECPSMLDPYY